MENYTLILGENPSKGARSPVLWNKTYSHFNISQKMYPKDIALNEFDIQIPKIFKDCNFLGGAVAVPYKEKIIHYTENKKDILSGPQAVNCLVRKDNKLYGYNTDGIATLNILEKNTDIKSIEQIILFGTGGMAKAVISEIQKKYSELKLLILDRNNDCLISQNGKLIKTNDVVDKSLTSIFINCSSAGYFNDIEIGKINKKVFEIHPYFFSLENKNDYFEQCLSTIRSFKDVRYILDVIYQPEKTLLLNLANYLGIPSQNGLEINLLQAAIGFQKVNPSQKLNEIFEIMNS